MKKKIRVGLLFGGRSGEHEVSVASATSVLKSLDPDKYEAVPIGITREGHWLIADSPEMLLEHEIIQGLPDTSEAMPDMTHRGIVRVDGRGAIDLHQTAVDVVFPLLHGTYGEDGTVQGLLELADLPYVGAGVLGSAVSMDKAIMKSLFTQAGLPIVADERVKLNQWYASRDEILYRIELSLEYPLFVKPCNLGSSVGISKAMDRQGLMQSLELAFRYDRKVIVEQGVVAREVECSVLGNDEPVVSVAGEVVSHHDWYDYESKYTEGLADLKIPALLSSEQARQVEKYARQAFMAVDAAGLARVDFFILKDDGRVIVNEINTIPGFTQTSMYPKLWEASGLPYPDLIDRLIQLAFDRHAEKSYRSVNR